MIRRSILPYCDVAFSSTNPNQEDVNEFIENVTLPVLTLEKQYVCEGDILEQECVNAIKKMKSSKSPGEDGLPIEFYRTFWNEIGSFLVSVYNDCFDNNILPLSMRRSIISLIHKKGDKTDIENYRPISLTNTDYRILTFVLANRLQKVIKDIVSPDQVAYIIRIASLVQTYD